MNDDTKQQQPGGAGRSTITTLPDSVGAEDLVLALGGARKEQQDISVSGINNPGKDRGRSVATENKMKATPDSDMALSGSATAKTYLEDDYKGQGKFFALAFIPSMMFAFVMFLHHFVTYLFTKTWAKNSAALAMGYVDPLEYETTTTSIILDAHAFLGCFVFLLSVIQVLTANMFRIHSLTLTTRATIETLHRHNGRIMAILWIATSLLGAVFPLISKRWDKEFNGEYTFTRIGVYTSSFLALGIATITNMVLGVWAVRMKDHKVHAALFLFQHKAYMFFSIYWIITVAFDELVVTTAQWIFNECYIDMLGTAICYSVGQLLQVPMFLWGMCWYDKRILNHRLVRVNVCFLVARAVLTIVGTVYLVVWTDNKAILIDGFADQDSCFVEEL